jgi:hypothetical protein
MEPNTAPPLAPARSGHASRAYFQYTGRTALTVVGATGNKYRFTHAGAIVAVDARDRRSISAVPGLRQVVGP